MRPTETPIPVDEQDGGMAAESEADADHEKSDAKRFAEGFIAKNRELYEKLARE